MTQRKPTTKTRATAKPARKAAARSATAAAAPSPADEQHRALLAAILADPADTRARLVLADLLQDRGDPRGELITMQCTRADLADDDPRAAEIDARAEELIKKHKKSWITRFGEAKGARWEFRRGFVEKLSIDAEPLARLGAAIFATEPIEDLAVWKIDESKVKSGSSRLAPVLAHDLSRVRRLSLARCKLQRADLEALGDATTLGKVELLDLSNCEITKAGAAILAAARSLPALRELRLGNNLLGDDGVAALAASRTLSFERLSLVRNDLRSAAGKAIAAATWAARLTHLDLSSNEGFDDAGLAALATSAELGALRSLKLEYTGIGEGSVPLILQSDVFGRLEHLDLSSNALHDESDDIRAKFGDRLHSRYG